MQRVAIRGAADCLLLATVPLLCKALAGPRAQQAPLVSRQGDR